MKGDSIRKQPELFSLTANRNAAGISRCVAPFIAKISDFGGGKWGHGLNSIVNQLDAYAVASWLRDTDANGRVALAVAPELTDLERAVAGVDGWILGLG